MIDLTGLVALITGAARGQGAEEARLFVELGAQVVLGDVRDELGKQVADELGERATYHHLDIADEASWKDVVARAISAHGRVDVLVNNVGDYRPLVRFKDSNRESWTAMYRINLEHFFIVTHAFLGSMIEHHHGVIVNVHSVEGLRGYPGEPVYGAMKGAVAHFTTCLAAEQGRNGIRVNAIGPDLTQTPQVDYLTGYEDHDSLWTSWAPVGRLGWPDDQARVALFLASDLSGFVTGHNVPVDGGTKAGGGWFWSPSARRFVNRPTTL
jgi:NAD(P)-dependent dehydrogenase (short-subunit alcohol dehydrogenase family)